jgi:phospholipase/carboxylesterase
MDTSDPPELAFEHDPSSLEGPAPAVCLLHGRGTDETDLLPLADRLPDELAVFSLRAPFPGGGGMGAGNVWYELDLSGGGLHQSQPGEGFPDSLAAVHAFAEGLLEDYPVTDVGLLGFSQGGIMGMSLLLERPDLYDWTVALHSYLPASHDPAGFEGVADKPVFVGAGEADQVIPVGRAREAAERLEAGGLSVTFRTYPSGHGIHPEELADAGEWVGDRL